MNPKALDFNLARQNLFTLDSCLAANVLANHSLIIAKYDFPLRNQASRTTKAVEAYHKVLYQSELDSIAKLYDDGSVFLAAMGPTSVAKGKRAKILYSNERRIVDGRRS
ncbi:hypothetical protein VTP01DRAFT_1349 [Rhizomucor pusillus]|uniref:uncharacterized protein n=1 Tax=Rhizomucor pusillus TaxID=4840 RepID=UPI0037421F3A